MRIAFIFAHPDDESLSSGGTIAKYSAFNHDVSVICLTSTVERKKEFLAATTILGCKNAMIFDYTNVESNQKELTQKLIDFIVHFQPSIIVTHIANDYHIDHRATFDIVTEAIEWAAHTTQHENAFLVSKLFVTETTILLPNPHYLVDISNFYNLKEQAINEYHSQLYKGGDKFYINFHNYRTRMRGCQAGTKHAEAFNEIVLKKNSPFYPRRHTDLYE